MDGRGWNEYFCPYKECRTEVFAFALFTFGRVRYDTQWCQFFDILGRMNGDLFFTLNVSRQRYLILRLRLIFICYRYSLT